MKFVVFAIENRREFRRIKREIKKISKTLFV
jgi:hypothetical protein